MLNHKYRFHARGGVRYVYQKGKTIRGVKMSLIFVPNTRGFTRVGVVVSRKVDKSAVVRNRIRRRLYEVVRMNFEKIPKRVDYVFVVYGREIATMKWQELEGLVGELVARVKT